MEIWNFIIIHSCDGAGERLIFLAAIVIIVTTIIVIIIQILKFNTITISKGKTSVVLGQSVHPLDNISWHW